MAYQALYRKWRPDNFEDVKGQDHIVTTLQNQIKADRIGHAYLFCGTRGTGKTSIAKIFAKAVNCEHPVNGSPCGECASCKAIAAGNSMNVIEIDAASNNGVDNIRQIREEVQYSPTQGRYKVYIIDEVHMLSIGAFNALLKTLEEPPSYVIFILATTEAHKIPVTILSRCQRYDFHRISIDTIADRLTKLMQAENINVEDKAIKYIAKAADGSLRDALSLLDQCIAFYLGRDIKYENVLDVLGAVDTQVYADMLSLIVASDTIQVMDLIEKLIMQGRDIGQFVSDFIRYLRNLLLIKTTDDISKIEDVIEASADSIAQLKKDSAIVDTDTIMRYIRILSELENELKYSSQKRIKLEVTLIKLMKPAMGAREDVSDILGRLSVLEGQMQDALNKLKNGVVPVGVFNQTPAADMMDGQPHNDSNAVADKRVIEALPQDMEAIARQWDGIVHSIDDPMMRTFLLGSHVTLTEDNTSLEIMFNSTSAYNAFSREEDKERLEALIEERTGVSVNIKITKLDDNEDFQNRFTDIRDLVSNIDIVVDDKEEYI